MGAFEDCYETLIENGRIAVFPVEQKVGKVICDEGFKSTDGGNDVLCVEGKWKTDAACVRTSVKSNASRKKREVDESATTPVSVTESSSSSINEFDETSPSINTPATPAQTPTPVPTTAKTTKTSTTTVLPESTTTITTKKTSTEKAIVPDDCPRECLQDRENGNMILILSLCLVGLMFLVIVLVICIARDHRRRTGEGVGRIQGAKKESKKPENVVLVDVTQADGKQGDATQVADVKANDPLPKADISGNTTIVAEKQENLLKVAEANARPIESSPSSNVASEVLATDNNSNKNEVSASIVKPSVDKAAEETPAELEKQAPPAANEVEMPPAPGFKEDFIAQPDVQLPESVLQDILKEAFGEGNN